MLISNFVIALRRPGSGRNFTFKDKTTNVVQLTNLENRQHLYKLDFHLGKIAYGLEPAHTRDYLNRAVSLSGWRQETAVSNSPFVTGTEVFMQPGQSRS